MNKQVVVMNIEEWIEAFVKHTGLVVEWWATAKKEGGFSDEHVGQRQGHILHAETM